jgi:hypothetical protein
MQGRQARDRRLITATPFSRRITKVNLISKLAPAQQKHQQREADYRSQGTISGRPGSEGEKKTCEIIRRCGAIE